MVFGCLEWQKRCTVEDYCSWTNIQIITVITDYIHMILVVFQKVSLTVKFIKTNPTTMLFHFILDLFLYNGSHLNKGVCLLRMPFKASWTDKTLVTLLAFVRLLTIVTDNMTLKCLLISKTLSTVLAQFCKASHWYMYVLFHVILKNFEVQNTCHNTCTCKGSHQSVHVSFHVFSNNDCYWMSCHTACA